MMGKKYKFREARKALQDEAPGCEHLKCVDFVADDGEVFTIAHSSPRIIHNLSKLSEWDSDRKFDDDDFDPVRKHISEWIRNTAAKEK